MMKLPKFIAGAKGVRCCCVMNVNHLYLIFVVLQFIFRMPTPQMEGSARSELQELQVKANQVADEVNNN